MLRFLVRDRRGALSLIVPVLGFAYLPLDVSFRPLRDPAKAQDLLQVLWQVEAAALALSLAVVIFIFEAVYGRRLRPELRSLAESIWLPPIFYAGIFGLLLDGMVLLGGGRGAPGAWAATWTLVWAALTGLLLIALFIFVLGRIEPAALHALRLGDVQRQVERATEDVVVDRIALVLLRDLCQRTGIEFVPVFGSLSAPNLTPVPAGRSGVVGDVNLWRVGRVGRLSREFGLTRDGSELPVLLARLGANVRHDSPVMRVAHVITGQMRISSAFKIRRDESEAAFRATLTRLHEEGMQAIREASPATYAGIGGIYERLLLALPETWARYGQQFVPQLAAGIHPFESGFLDIVERNLYDELELAALGPSREVAHEALNLPLEVAIRATRLRASALSGRVMLLFGAVVVVVIRSPDSEERRRLLDWCLLRLHEYGGGYVEPLITDDSSDQVTREYGAAALIQVFDVLAQLGKAVIDHDPRETWLMTEINRYWNEFLEHWHPEHTAPRRWELEFLEERGDVPARQLEQVRASVVENEARAKTREEVDTWRGVERFGLLFWALRRLRDRRDPIYVEAWDAFAGYFGDVDALARIADCAIQADFEDRGRWSNWVLGELPRGQVHAMAVDIEFLQTFIVRALNLISPDGPTPQIEPFEWLAGRLEEAQATVQGVIENEALGPLLPEDRLEERAAKLVEAFQAMLRAREEQRDQRVIDAPLDDESVGQFTNSLRGAWRANRLLAPALGLAEQLEVIVGEADEDASRLGLRRWMPKGMFISDPRVMGAGWAANDIGRGLAEAEIEKLAEAAIASPEFAGREGMSLAERLRAAIVEVRQHGELVVVLVPVDWQLVQALELTMSGWRGGGVDPPGWLPEGGRDSFLGTADEVPVFDARRMPENKIVLIALDSFARWRQWRSAEDAPDVEVSLTAYGEEEARVLAEEREELFRADDRTTADARARAVRKSVLLDIIERFKVDVVNPEAARWLEVPVEFRQE